MNETSRLQRACRILKRILNAASVILCLFLAVIAAAIVLWLFLGERYLGGETVPFHIVLEIIDNAGFEDTLVLLISDFIFCLGKITVLRFATGYLKRELSDGTPYTSGGVKKLRRAGTGIIIVSLLSQIVIFTLCEMYSIASVYRIEVGTALIGALLVFFSVVLKSASDNQEEEGGAITE